jgi:hypothetical protein
MKSCILAFTLLSRTESVPTALSAGCVQDDHSVSTSSPAPQGTTVTGRVVDKGGDPVAAGPGGVDSYAILVHSDVTSAEIQGLPIKQRSFLDFALLLWLESLHACKSQLHTFTCNLSSTG